MKLQTKKMSLVEQLMQVNVERILTAVQSVLSFGLDKKRKKNLKKR